MSLEVRQLVLRARVQDEPDADDDQDGVEGATAKRKGKQAAACGGQDDPCEDRESLKEEILAACRVWLREELRALRER